MPACCLAGLCACGRTDVLASVLAGVLANLVACCAVTQQEQALGIFMHFGMHVL